MNNIHAKQPDNGQHSLDLLLDRGLSNRLTLIVGPDARERGQALNDWLDRREYSVLQIEQPEGVSGYGCLKWILDAFVDAGIINASTTIAESSEACHAALVDLMNQLATIDRDLVVIFRNYEPCDTGNRVLSFILEHLPQQVHLYLCCDDDPGLSCIPRLRVRRQLQTIDTSGA